VLRLREYAVASCGNNVAHARGAEHVFLVRIGD
jgi:hypothetical protein